MHIMRIACSFILILMLSGCGESAPTEPALDPAIAAQVHDLVDGDDGEKRDAAHKALPAHGAKIVMPLAAALDRSDVDAGIGAWIAGVLGALGPIAEPAAPALYRRLIQGGECSATTSWALGQIGDPGVPYLAKALSSQHEKARIWAVDALTDLEERADPAGEALLAVLDDSSIEVRKYAPNAIAYLPRVRNQARPKLLALTRDENEDVRLSAAEALAELFPEDESVQSRLHELIRVDPSETLRETLKDTLNEVKGGGK